MDIKAMHEADVNYKLRAWMGANKVSVRKLSEMTEIPYDTLKLKMSGKHQWKLSDIEALMEATGCEFHDIF